MRTLERPLLRGYSNPHVGAVVVRYSVGPVDLVAADSGTGTTADHGTAIVASADYAVAAGIEPTGGAKAG